MGGYVGLAINWHGLSETSIGYVGLAWAMGDW
jgi:hypothetical protein